MVWDLDEVAASKGWNVGVFELSEMESLPHFDELRRFSSGTLVIWEKLDILAAGDAGDGEILGERMRQVGEHLGLVFHRYLADRGRPLAIDINMQPVIPLDPFLENDGTVIGEEEKVLVEGQPVFLRAFTLPHISRLTKRKLRRPVVKLDSGDSRVFMFTATIG